MVHTGCIAIFYLFYKTVYSNTQGLVSESCKLFRDLTYHTQRRCLKHLANVSSTQYLPVNPNSK